MVIRRKRLTQQDRERLPPLAERAKQVAKDIESAALQMPPGPQRDSLMRRAQLIADANRMNEALKR